ncbi:MAG: hypothetical protein OHK0048_01920 [Rhodoferax sp.]
MRTLLTLLFLALPLPLLADTNETTPVVESVDCDVDPSSCVTDEPADATEDPFGGEVDPLEVDGTLVLDNSGVLDGIYVCDVRYGTGAPSRSQIFVSVNGKSNGDAIFIIGEIDERPDSFFGWGIGRVADETDGITFHFSGNTSEGEPFTLTATYQEDESVLASGEVIVKFRDPAGGTVGVKSQLSCQSIW